VYSLQLGDLLINLCKGFTGQTDRATFDRLQLPGDGQQLLISLID